MIFNNITLYILNRILSQNESSLNILKNHHGKVIKINALGVAMVAEIGHDGLLVNYQGDHFDVEIIVPANIMSSLIKQDPLASLKQVNIMGDSAFGLTFIKTLSNLHFSGTFDHESPIVKFAASKTFYLISKLGQYLKTIHTTNVNSIIDYMVFEKRLVITRSELDTFCNDVDQLKMQTEQLFKQIAHLVRGKL